MSRISWDFFSYQIIHYINIETDKTSNEILKEKLKIKD